MTRRAICSAILIAVPLCAGCAGAQIGPISGKKYSGYAVWMGNYDKDGAAYLQEVRLAGYLKAHPDTSSDMKQMILEGKVQIGMTAEQVVSSWGSPQAVNKTMSGWGTSEQWIYGDPLYGAQYLYFDNGKLTSMQTSH